MNKDILKLGLILAVFAGAACVALAVVNGITEPVIEGLAAKELQNSLAAIFTEADGFEDLNGTVVSSDPAITVTGAWKATKGSDILGVAIKAVGKSYGGDAVMLVGVRNDQKLAGIRILTLTDTPGLGANATSPTYFVDKTTKTTFPGQFTGKAVSDPFEVKKDVDVITASTITSKALATIAKRAGEAGAGWLVASAGGK